MPKGTRHQTLSLVARVRAVTRAFSPLGSMQITERSMVSRLGMMVPTPLPLRVGAMVRRWTGRSEEHTSELQSLMRNSYDVFCLKKKNQTQIVYNLSPQKSK